MKALNKPVFHLIRPRGLLARRCPPFSGPNLAARHPHHWPCFSKAVGIHIQPARKRRKLAAPFLQSNLDSSQRRLKRTRGEFRKEEQEGGGVIVQRKKGPPLTCFRCTEVFECWDTSQSSSWGSLGCSEVLQLGSLGFYSITFPGDFFLRHSPSCWVCRATSMHAHTHTPSTLLQWKNVLDWQSRAGLKTRCSGVMVQRWRSLSLSRFSFHLSFSSPSFLSLSTGSWTITTSRAQ